MPRPGKNSYGETKPAKSYIALTYEAIESSPLKMLPLSDIYEYIEQHYSFYRENRSRWQNSLRHNLSFNQCFIKVPRPANEPGKGHYWKVHPLAHDMFANGSALRRRKRFKLADPSFGPSLGPTSLKRHRDCGVPLLRNTLPEGSHHQARSSLCWFSTATALQNMVAATGCKVTPLVQPGRFPQCWTQLWPREMIPQPPAKKKCDFTIDAILNA